MPNYLMPRLVMPSECNDLLSQCQLPFVALTYAFHVQRLVELQLQLSDTKSQVMVLEEANDELFKANSSLKKENIHLASSLNTVNQELSSRIDYLENEQNEVQQLREMEKTKNGDIAGLNDRICKYAAADQKLQQELCESKLNLQEVQNTNTNLKKEVERLEKKNTDLITALRLAESSRLDLNETKTALDAAQRQLAAAEKREKEAVALTNKAKDETAKVMTEMSSKLESSCNEIRLEMERTHKIDIDLISNDMKRATEENCRLTVKLEHYSEQLEEIKSRNSVIETENVKVEASLSEEKRQTELLQARLRKVSMIICLQYQCV